MDQHAASPAGSGGVMLRRQLLSPPCGGTSSSPQSSPCPSPVTAGGRLRPHSIALASAGEGGTPQQQLQQFLGNVVVDLFFICLHVLFPPIRAGLSLPLLMINDGDPAPSSSSSCILPVFSLLTRLSTRGHANLPSPLSGFIFIDVDVYLTTSAKRQSREKKYTSLGLYR
jgi:hypothetical protein